jgi:hypothetical protein
VLTLTGAHPCDLSRKPVHPTKSDTPAHRSRRARNLASQPLNNGKDRRRRHGMPAQYGAGKRRNAHR